MVNHAITSKFGRSCANARRAFAKRFGLGRKSWALTYAILSRYIKICRDLRTFWKTLCKKGLSWVKKCPFTWYIIYKLYIAYHTEWIMQLTHNEGSLIGKIQNPSPCVGNCSVKHQFMTLILALWLHYQWWPHITNPKVKKSQFEIMLLQGPLSRSWWWLRLWIRRGREGRERPARQLPPSFCHRIFSSC